MLELEGAPDAEGGVAPEAVQEGLIYIDGKKWGMGIWVLDCFLGARCVCKA